jgi:hypothetical protein
MADDFVDVMIKEATDVNDVIRKGGRFVSRS